MPTQLFIDARENAEDVLGLQDCEHGVIARTCDQCQLKMKERKNATGVPRSMKCSFIEPGVVNYADVGMVYVGKAALDKMANSMIGRPIVNEVHRTIDADEFSKGTVQGIVNSVWFEPTDGMFHCAYQVWDQKTLNNMNRGYKVSCAYNVIKWGPGGIHNNVPYEKEVLEGEYTHLAIVDNPRYESVRIYNAKGAKTMTLNWIKKLIGADGKEMENSVTIESSKSKVEINGKEVPMDDLINAFAEQEEKRAKALENRAPADTDIIDIGNGKKVTVGDLKKAYETKNAMDDDEEKKKKEKDDADEKERKNAAEKAAALQLKNDMDKAHAEGKHDPDAQDNCTVCNELKNKKGKEHFERIDALANSRTGEFVNDLPEIVDPFEEGLKAFGSIPALKK